MLAETQSKLWARFKELSARREPLKYPVYALEHGLEAAEIAELRRQASDAIRSAPPSYSHWLVWAALGAEAGYGYSGDEYWPQLEVVPGEWRSNETRKALRTFLRRFTDEFRGPEPVGRWADQFSIIAWPIAHAILPKYLQVHFARHIFELKHGLSHLAQGEGKEIGTYLLQHYRGTNSRFRDFLQQTELTTQIVLALRDQEAEGSVARIEPALLDRIVTDLEARSDARAYLRDTRRLIQSTSVKLAATLRGGSPTASVEATQPSPQRPRLVARRMGDRFGLGVQLPDVRSNLTAVGLDESALSGQRVRFTGPSERPLPASQLLSLSNLNRKLEHFPKAGAAFAEAVDQAHPLAAFLKSFATLEERRTWVLRRQTNGLFREVLGGHVRPKQDYLLLSRAAIDPTTVSAAGLAPVAVEADGVVAYALRALDKISAAAQSALATIAVGSITGLSVEPAGLNPFTVGDLPAWLSTEPVFLRLSADFEVGTLNVSLDAEPPMAFQAEGKALLLQLGELSVGRHKVTVSANGSGNGQGQHVRAEEFEFEIVVPRPWPEAMREKSGFRVVLDPPNASLDTLLGGTAKLRVFGPPGREVHWSVETHDAAGHVAAAGEIGVGHVGAATDRMAALLDRMRTEYSDALDEAYQVDIVASLDELGRQSQTFPRTVEPVRWKFDAKSGQLRLIDETDHATPIRLRWYPLTNPLKATELAIDQALAGFAPLHPGGLFVAKRGQSTVSIFVSLPVARRLKDLRELATEPTFDLPPEKGKSIIRLVNGMSRWGKAKPVGYLALLRRDTTVVRLRAELEALCCGRDFSNLLRSQNSLEPAQRKVGGSPGFGFRMRTGQWPPDPMKGFRAFEDFAQRYGVTKDVNLCRAAFMLAFSPDTFRLDDKVDKPTFMDRLAANVVLLRGAYLAHAVSALPTVTAMKETA